MSSFSQIYMIQSQNSQVVDIELFAQPNNSRPGLSGYHICTKTFTWIPLIKIKHGLVIKDKSLTNGPKKRRKYSNPLCSLPVPFARSSKIKHGLVIKDNSFTNGPKNKRKYSTPLCSLPVPFTRSSCPNRPLMRWSHAWTIPANTPDEIWYISTKKTLN